MKQKDIAVIVAVAVLSAVVSMVVAHFVFDKPQNHKQKAEVVQAISPDFPAADTAYFNQNAIDPTEPIRIGDNNNSDPFREAAKP